MYEQVQNFEISKSNLFEGVPRTNLWGKSRCVTLIHVLDSVKDSQLDVTVKLVTVTQIIKTMSWSCACSPKTAPKNVSAHGKSPFYSPIHQGLSPGLPPLSPLALPRAGEGNGQSHPVPKLILSSLPDHSNTADELSALDEWFINQTFKLKDKLLLTPIHTNFRVFAVIAYRTTSGERR